MPYVKQERRPALNEVVNELVKADIIPGDLELFLLNLTHNFCRFKSEHILSDVLLEAREANVKPNGDINYILFKYCKYHVKPSYNNYKAFMGEINNAMERTKWNYIIGGNYKDEFRESAEWIRIKILTPYEEKSIERNGDV